MGNGITVWLAVWIGGCIVGFWIGLKLGRRLAERERVQRQLDSYGGQLHSREREQLVRDELRRLRR